MSTKRFIYFPLYCGLIFMLINNARATPGWNSVGSGLNGSVYAILINGNDVYVGGAFTNAGGNPDADYIARWDGSAWQAVGPGLGAAVRCIALDAGNNVYAGGEFTNAGGNANADRVAFWDGGSWQALGTGVSHTVWAIGISGTDVFVGGDFANAGGNQNADYIARWDGAAWQAMGTGTGNWVRGIAVNGSDVYVTGGFSNLGGNPNADGVARWDGAAWHALGTGGMTFWAHAIAINGTDVYIGGGFFSAGGNANANYIARWDGNSWNALGTGTGGSVFAIAVDGTDVYAGGSFYNSGAGTSNIARWNGSSWNALGAGLNNTVYAAARLDNNVYVGGDFLNAGSIASADRIARWENTALPVELTGFTATPDNKRVRLTWQTRTESQNDYFQVEHSTNGHNFYPLNQISGNGTTQLPHEYTYWHDNPAQGLNYYRLIQVDYNGTPTVSAIKSVVFSTLYPDITLAPNPTSGYVLVTSQNFLQAKAKIISLPGKTILEKELNDHQTLIELAGYPPGWYVIEIEHKGMVSRHQLVIN